jgi:hypothetical protein
MLHQAGQFRNQLIQSGLFLVKNVEKILIFTNCGHSQALKVRGLKVLCPSQLCTLKDRKINVGI